MKPDERYDSLFQFYAERSDVDWKKLKAQGRAESLLNPDAKSRVGATGLMQFMPRTWEEWQDGTPGIQEEIDKLKLLDMRDPEDSIRAAAAYMGWLLKRFNGDYRTAWAAYNWGIGNVRGAMTSNPENWFASAPKETRDYVERIESYLV